jgi:HK97 gp10 family phage protein
LTGNLKANIIVSKVKDGKIDIGPDQQGCAFYGYFLEFGRSAGTRKHGSAKGFKYPAMPPHPFMQPAFEENVVVFRKKWLKLSGRH